MAGAVLSLVLHGTGAAYFARDPDEISIAASRGGGVSVIGSLEDLVAGSMVDAIPETRPVEMAEPETTLLEPVKAEAQAAPVEAGPVLPAAEFVPVKPVAAPVSAVPATPAPVAAGILSTEPVSAVDTVEAIPRQAKAPPLDPATIEPPAEFALAEIAPAEILKPQAVLQPVQPDSLPLEALPEPRQEDIRTPRTKPAPPVRKTEPRKDPKQSRQSQAQVRGAETSSSKGGERITSRTATSNANGRADARTDDGGTKASSNYKGKVVAKLRRAKRYPKQALRQRLRGDVHIAFTISANGSVSGIRVLRSSGHPVLDQAAIDMVKRAAPMPAFPSDLRLPRMTVEIPVGFDRK
jgi:protein TonB